MSIPRPDLTRLLAVTASEVLCIAGTLLGVGVFGGPPVAESAGGALSADATLLAPASPAFSIWTVIYIGLAAYTVWQWLPRQRTATRHRRIGWLVAASMLLNAAWLLVVRAGLLWVSVVTIVALVVVLGLLVRRLAATPGPGGLETYIVDGTFGLYAGWVSVAVCANITATLVAQGVTPGSPAREIAAALVLAAAVAVAVALAAATRGNVAVGIAMAWGIGWIAVGRLLEAPESAATGVAAIVAALAVIVVTIAGRVKSASLRPS
jgi:hypothetical protein